MRKGVLIYEEMRKYFPKYDEAVSQIGLCNCSTLNFLLYEENLIFFYRCGDNVSYIFCFHICGPGASSALNMHVFVCPINSLPWTSQFAKVIPGPTLLPRLLDYAGLALSELCSAMGHLGICDPPQFICTICTVEDYPKIYVPYSVVAFVNS